MSINHRLEDEELSDTSLYELYSILGERDTPRLFEQTFKLDTNHDCPTGAGNTVDRNTVLIDRLLYQQVMDNEFKASGLDPVQIINAWCQHEHSEICIVQGDNAVDTQPPAHKRALRREHEFVNFCGAEVAKYESVIWPALVACYNRQIKNPHPDLWCGPLLDSPSARDEEIIGQLQKFGVRDASKRSRYEVHYGFGSNQCARCRNVAGRGVLEQCRIVDGLVRCDRNCDFFQNIGVRSVTEHDELIDKALTAAGIPTAG